MDYNISTFESVRLALVTAFRNLMRYQHKAVVHSSTIRHHKYHIPRCAIYLFFLLMLYYFFRLIFGAWSYHTTKMNLTNSATVVNLDSYEENGEWEIYRTESRRNVREMLNISMNNKKGCEILLYLVYLTSNTLHSLPSWSHLVSLCLGLIAPRVRADGTSDTLRLTLYHSLTLRPTPIGRNLPRLDKRNWVEKKYLHNMDNTETYYEPFRKQNRGFHTYLKQYLNCI